MRHNRTDAFSDQLPSVGGGMQINAEHVNRLSRAVERNQIRSMIGARGITRGPRGTSLLMNSEKRLTRPFEVTVNGSGVIMRDGRVWSSQGNFAYGGVGNTWGNFINYAAIPNAEYIVAEDDVNYWYWPHQDKAKDYMVWIEVAGAFSTPTLRYTEIQTGSSIGETEEAQKGYPIAIVRSSLTGAESVDPNTKAAYDVFQIIEQDIFSYDDTYPFKVSPYLTSFSVDLEGGGTASVLEVRATMQFGTINNVEPKYEDGKRISDSGASISLLTNPLYGSTYTFVYFRVKIEPKPSNVPVEITVMSGGTIPANTSIYAYLLVARVDIAYIKAPSGQVQQPPSIASNNSIRSSLWAEAHRYVPFGTDYFFYRL